MLLLWRESRIIHLAVRVVRGFWQGVTALARTSRICQSLSRARRAAAADSVRSLGIMLLSGLVANLVVAWLVHKPIQSIGWVVRAVLVTLGLCALRAPPVPLETLLQSSRVWTWRRGHPRAGRSDSVV